MTNQIPILIDDNSHNLASRNSIQINILTNQWCAINAEYYHSHPVIVLKSMGRLGSLPPFSWLLRSEGWGQSYWPSIQVFLCWKYNPITEYVWMHYCNPPPPSIHPLWLSNWQTVISKLFTCHQLSSCFHASMFLRYPFSHLQYQQSTFVCKSTWHDHKHFAFNWSI